MDADNQDKDMVIGEKLFVVATSVAIYAVRAELMLHIVSFVQQDRLTILEGSGARGAIGCLFHDLVSRGREREDLHSNLNRTSHLS